MPNLNTRIASPAILASLSCEAAKDLVQRRSDSNSANMNEATASCSEAGSFDASAKARSNS